MNPASEVLTVGIVGAGAVVRDAHLPVLDASPGLEPVWITDVDDVRARRLARIHGLRHVPARDAVAGLPEASIVLLAVPPGARDATFESLRGRDVALYVEKPVAASVAAHLHITSSFPPAFRGAHGLQRRSFGPTRLARRLVQDGLFGALRAIDCGFGVPGGGRHAGFRSDVRQAQGGILLEHGIHLLDCALYLAHAEHASLRSARMEFVARLDVHAELELELSSPFASAVPCSLRCSWLAETEPGIRVRFEHAELAFSIYDEGGTLRITGRGAREGYRVLPEWRDAVPLSAAQTLFDHWAHAARALRERRPNYTSATEALLTTQVIEAAYDRARGTSAGAPPPS